MRSSSSWPLSPAVSPAFVPHRGPHRDAGHGDRLTDRMVEFIQQLRMKHRLRRAQLRLDRQRTVGGDGRDLGCGDGYQRGRAAGKQGDDTVVHGILENGRSGSAPACRGIRP